MTTHSKPQHAPEHMTPQSFVVKFPKYVYRSHKNQVSVQWREAALDAHDEIALLRSQNDALRNALALLVDVEDHHGIPTDEHFVIARSALAAKVSP